MNLPPLFLIHTAIHLGFAPLITQNFTEIHKMAMGRTFNLGGSVIRVFHSFFPSLLGGTDFNKNGAWGK